MSKAVKLSQDDLACRVTAEYRDQLRYECSRGLWLIWQGSHWQTDKTGQVLQRVRQVCREVARELANSDKQGEARKLSSQMNIAAVEKLLRSDPAHATGSVDWDAHPMLLATPGGTVDLTTGELREAGPDELLTRLAGSTASPTADCPLWLRFIHQCMGGDEAKMAWFKRWCGYCLTGSTQEQVFVFLHGAGGNGKSVLLNLLSFILGQHAQAASPGLFMQKRYEGHPTQLASLNGARLVIGQETDQKAVWNTTLIKQLTGGDMIRARFMHRDEFSFTPSCKLMISGNHLPELGEVGEAMARRMILLGFEHVVPKAERDPDLENKLKAEAAGILHWMIEGCLEWQAQGLNTPESMRQAARAYFEQEDVIGQWLEECCVIEEAAFTPTELTLKSYNTWAKLNGYERMTSKRLKAELKARGLDKVRRRAETENPVNGYLGMKVIR